MRIKDKKVEISYEDTHRFFSERAKKYNEKNPYSVTMYQDDAPHLVEERNKAEQEKILPMLKLDEESKVIDIGCGIGRWADAISFPINRYFGIDFLQELIDIASARNKKSNFEFNRLSAVDIKTYMEKKGMDLFNRVIISGVLMYLNDRDVDCVLRELGKICEGKSVIYIREPVDLIEERLTLKNFYSDELNSDYNVIYRSSGEFKDKIKEHLIDNGTGYKITEEGILFEKDSLNNRKETSQYYFILERG